MLFVTVLFGTGILVSLTEPPIAPASRLSVTRIARERHLFGNNDGLPRPYRNLEGVNSGCTMLFPFGTFERRYQLTGASGEVYLNCNMKRNGKIVGTWTIPLVESKEPSKRWTAGGIVFEGTLVKYVANAGYEPSGPIPKAAHKALQANKSFACYWASLMGSSLSWWAITEGGLRQEENQRPIKQGDVVYADGPYPITKAERKWILSQPG
ncbi:MAG: hypothetical protein ABL962_07105 [Fimbriimonadaceae bacterium]